MVVAGRARAALRSAEGMRADMFVVEGVEVEVDCLGEYRYVLGDMLEGGGWCLFGVLLLACLLVAGRRLT